MDTPQTRFRTAIELRRATIAMQRQLLIREHPEASREEIDRRLEAWVVDPGEEPRDRERTAGQAPESGS